jgi:hypothetical protein
MSRDDKIFHLLWCWLMAVVGLSFLMALTLILQPATSLYAEYNATYARAFWGQATLPPEALRQHQFTMGVVGAGVIGWIVSLAWILAVPFRRRERWAFWSCVSAIGIWVLLDVAICLWFAVWGDLVFVSAAAAGFAVPLVLSARFFRDARSASMSATQE